MTIDRIEYQKNYNIIGMQWEKILAGGTLEEGDNFQDCIKKLRSECDSAAQTKFEAIYQDQYSKDPLLVNKPSTFSVSPIPEKIPQDVELQNLINEIENSTPETLPTYKLAAAKNQRTMGAFNKRKKQLNIE